MTESVAYWPEKAEECIRRPRVSRIFSSDRGGFEKVRNLSIKRCVKLLSQYSGRARTARMVNESVLTVFCDDKAAHPKFNIRVRNRTDSDCPIS
jgi:hypothetical protein